MESVTIATAASILALAGQVANYVLNLKLRAAILEAEKRVADRIDAKYQSQAICEVRMRAVEQQLNRAATSPKAA